MLRFHPSRFIWALALMLGMWMVGSQAQEYRYHYVSLSQAASNQGFVLFDPWKITNSGRVYGTVYTAGTRQCGNIAVYENGTLTILQAGKSFAATESGTIGGAVLKERNPAKYPWCFYKATLFHGKKVEELPGLQGEISSTVKGLSDSGIALVESLMPPPCEDCPYLYSYYVLYPNGESIPIPMTLVGGFDEAFPPINNQGLIAGTEVIWGPPRGDRAFLLNPRSGELTLLNPFPLPDTLSWGMDINNRGDVLGYSFAAFGVPAHIGVWSNHGQFETYFDEADTKNGGGFVSNALCFNDNNLIAISAIEPPQQINSGKGYLVPKPGVLLNLADLVDDYQQQIQPFTSIVIRDVNNHGDMIGCGYNPDYGTSFCGRNQVFLLERVGPGKPLK